MVFFVPKADSKHCIFVRSTPTLSGLYWVDDSERGGIFSAYSGVGTISNEKR